MLKKLLRSEKGFTLIELMVVILIIAILVVIAIPVYNAAQTAAKKNSCYANLRTMNGAIATYQGNEDVEPGTIGALVPDYIKKAPSCPDTGSYNYNTNSGIDDTTCSQHGTL